MGMGEDRHKRLKSFDEVQADLLRLRDTIIDQMRPEGSKPAAMKGLFERSDISFSHVPVATHRGIDIVAPFASRKIFEGKYRVNHISPVFDKPFTTIEAAAEAIEAEYLANKRSEN